MSFEIGQIFEGEYPSEVADFCNNRGDCYIEEIEPVTREEERQEIVRESYIDENGKEIPAEYKVVIEEVTVRRFEIVREPVPSLETLQQAVCDRVDKATSDAIFAGFFYTYQGKELHFSYDTLDQQNFADTANVAILSGTGVSGLPMSVTWNAYQNYTLETGGELVRITLTPEEFLHLYTQGALVHKATQMEIGGQRKSAITAATDSATVKALVEEWGI